MSNSKPALGTSIRIFLADGSADGVWIVEKSNWTGKALMAPRTRFKELKARSDLSGPGVYVLSGPTDSGLPPTRLYVGETDDLPGRLENHNRNKDFWNRVIVFTAKDDNLNKAHIRYLEARLISLAKDANLADVENATVGSMPPLSEPDIAEAEGFLREMLLIYPVLGVSAFHRPEQLESNTERLFLNALDTNAEGTETADGFLVYAGSIARASGVPSISTGGTELRAALQDNGSLVQHGDQLRLTRDTLFKSPSAAAMVMLGRTSNGREEWKNSAGVSLKTLQS